MNWLSFSNAKAGKPCCWGNKLNYMEANQFLIPNYITILSYINLGKTNNKFQSCMKKNKSSFGW